MNPGKRLTSFAGFCIGRRELGLGSYSLRRDFLPASRRGSHEAARDVLARAALAWVLPRNGKAQQSKG